MLLTRQLEVRGAVVLASPASDHLQLVADLAVPGRLVGNGRRSVAAGAR